MRCASAANGRRRSKVARRVRGCFGTWIRAWKRIWQADEADAPDVFGITILRYRDGCRTQPLGNHRAPRSPSDAADEPVARAAVDPVLDDCGHADGRWLAVVRAGWHAADLWRAAAICRGGSGFRRRRWRRLRIQNH